MTIELSTGAGLPERALNAGGGKPAAPRQRRMSAQWNQEAVLWVLRGEDLERVSRELGDTVAAPSGWLDGFLATGAASLTSRAENGRDREPREMREKVGEITMANELLEAKIDRLEAGVPPQLRRSKR
jgi:hypothetical protein